ncbi:hypothetical protein ACFYVL_09325 [Streptomyces sp. NPDC004111]|uniref:hypothetical protein n=1 Tax=Streptomyces sp. NPDC004111 TaxID=3364690 RepID=UPI0036A9E9CC
MSRHLIDKVAVGWQTLGTDLLDGAPPALLIALTGGEQWASRTLDHLVQPDGSPPRRMTVDQESVITSDFQWGYILRPNGIEVRNVFHEEPGPVVAWSADPRTVCAAPWPAPAARHTRGTPPLATAAPAKATATRTNTRH